MKMIELTNASLLIIDLIRGYNKEIGGNEFYLEFKDNKLFFNSHNEKLNQYVIRDLSKCNS